MQLNKKRGEPLKSSIRAAMQLKTTEELEAIWRSNDHTQWSDAAFDAVREILLERTHELPEQAAPITTVPEYTRSPFESFAVGAIRSAVAFWHGYAKLQSWALAVLAIIIILTGNLFTIAGLALAGAAALSIVLYYLDRWLNQR